jgi:hypothetical protein
MLSKFRNISSLMHLTLYSFASNQSKKILRIDPSMNLPELEKAYYAGDLQYFNVLDDLLLLSGNKQVKEALVE